MILLIITGPHQKITMPLTGSYHPPAIDFLRFDEGLLLTVSVAPLAKKPTPQDEWWESRTLAHSTVSEGLPKKEYTPFLVEYRLGNYGGQGISENYDLMAFSCSMQPHSRP